MGLVLAEIRKLRTVRTTWAVTALGWLLVAFLSGLVVLESAMSGVFVGSDADIAGLVDGIGGNSVIVLVVAILAMTTEFRHETIGRTLQLTPSRTKVFASKLVGGVLYALLFFVTSLVVVGLWALIAVLAKDATVEVGSLVRAALWQGPAGLALTAVFGVAFGSLVRSQVLGITVALVWVFIVESVINGLLPAVGRWLPFVALNSIFANEAFQEGPPNAVPLSGPVAFGVFVVYVVVVSVPAIVLMRVRDV